MTTPNPYLGHDIHVLNNALYDLAQIITRAKEYGKQFPHQLLISELAEVERGYVLMAIKESDAPKALIVNINDLTDDTDVKEYNTVFVYFNSAPSARLLDSVSNDIGKQWQGIVEYRTNLLYAFSSPDMPVSPNGYQLTSTQNYNVPF